MGVALPVRAALGDLVAGMLAVDDAVKPALVLLLVVVPVSDGDIPGVGATGLVAVVVVDAVSVTMTVFDGDVLADGALDSAALPVTTFDGDTLADGVLIGVALPVTAFNGEKLADGVLDGVSLAVPVWVEDGGLVAVCAAPDAVAVLVAVFVGDIVAVLINVADAVKLKAIGTIITARNC